MNLLKQYNIGIIIFIIMTFSTNSYSQLNNEVDLQKKLHSMMLLSAYGDARGAPTEGMFPEQPSFELVPVDSFYYGSHGPWWIWFEEDDLSGSTKGIVTDDTYFRIVILTKYKDWIKKTQSNLGDLSFAKFLVDIDKKIKDNSLVLPNNFESFRLNFELQVYDWIGMLNESLCTLDGQREYCFADVDWKPLKNARVSFFIEDKSICFGLFMYLPLVIDHLAETPEEIFSSFLNISSLDRSHAPFVTASMAVLISNALKSKSHQPFDLWLQENIDQLLEYDEVPANSKEVFLETVNYLSSAFGAEMSFEEIRLKLYDKRMNLSGEVVGLKHDSIEFLSIALLVSKWAENDFDLIFDLIVNSGGDTDTFGSFMGLLLGAYLDESKWSPKMIAESEHVLAHINNDININLDELVIDFLN